MIEERLRRHRRRKRILYGSLAAAVLLTAAAVILFFRTYLTSITVMGNKYLSQEMVSDMLFGTQMEQRTFYARWREKTKEHEELPMISSYSLEFDGLHSVRVNIAEHEVIGGIAYVDTYLYFDMDGYLLCSSSERLEGIPIFSGVVFGQLILYQKAQTDQEDIFADMRLTAQLLAAYGIQAQTVSYDEIGNLMITTGNIRVNLGSADELEGKLNELRSMESVLTGLQGELHLEDYSAAGDSGGYIFVPD